MAESDEEQERDRTGVGAAGLAADLASGATAVSRALTGTSASRMLVRRGFLLRKLHADVVSDDGDVLVAHLAWLRVAGVHTPYAVVERYPAGGGREVLRGRPIAGSPRRRRDGGMEYSIATRDGRTLRLVHHAPVPAWHPSDPQISPRMHWHVAVPYARAEASWEGAGPDPGADAGAARLVGTGYSDWVWLRLPPRLLGLRWLRWGRIHLPGRTIVFNTVDRSNGLRWTRVTEWRVGAGPVGGDPIGGDPVELVIDGAPRTDGPADGLDAWTVPAPGGPVNLEPLRVLHEGEPLDADRFPDPWERWGSRVANGPSYETRWLSSARDASGATGMVVHESVRFGR
ncbi:hypothetical protein SAMN05421678_1026 [Actinopolymorpha cephalotaxi]|uniref:Uncharacterized protein n=1 Tax=Actinopolymorpha cephalotaxi TaxID=504797 RepID=A0A1I2L829_9ACTN|nr:hypothetical protein [Actinopolymorpha cephalotaxi]NYH85024.1 hypothetical protein [Actinopolymorpha cephalotaxi]SFF75512.1 hypothetical protein SAMN05421678_1026 [Actinopolymorpha cephalotaxi]